MLIVSTILLLLFIPLVMVVLYLARPKFGIQGFLVVLAIIAGWILVFIARSDQPQFISLLIWEPVSFFPNSPALLVDKISWSFSLALMSLTVALTITSISELGQSLKPAPGQNPSKIEVEEIQAPTNTTKGSINPVTEAETGRSSTWRSWASMLVLTSFGLVAISAGNMLTMVLGWAGLDVIELVILMGQVFESRARERIVLAFSAKMAGIGVALLAGIIPWSHGISLSFDSINQSTSIYLILAAGLRLGVLPIHLPLHPHLPARRGLGTALRLIPAVTSYILLVRVANVGVSGPATPYLLGFAVLAGLYAGFHWISARDELDGRPFWLIGSGSLAVASAILNQPLACLAWSIASVLSGGLVFSMSIRHKNLIPIALLGVLSFSALPFSPTWLGSNLYKYTSSLTTVISAPIFYVLTIGFLLIHSVLLGGFIKHSIRGILPTEKQSSHIESWVWFLYPIGLMFIILTHFLIGFLFQPNLSEISVVGWVIGATVVIISVLIGYFFNRYGHEFIDFSESRNASHRSTEYSIESVFRLFWRIYRFVARISSLISAILEGDGGILWALVLFALIFVFLQR